MKIKKNIAISDSGFIFDPSTGDSFATNPIGLEILQMIRQGRSQQEIGRHILETYNTDAVSFEKDYYDFVSMLQKLKLTADHEKEKN